MSGKKIHRCNDRCLSFGFLCNLSAKGHIGNGRKTKRHQWRMQGRGPGGPPPPPLFLDQTEARRAEKNFFWDRGPPLSQGLDDRPPPSPSPSLLSEGLDPPMGMILLLDYFPLSVRLSLLKYLLWKRYCSYHRPTSKVNASQVVKTSFYRFQTLPPHTPGITSFLYNLWWCM